MEQDEMEDQRTYAEHYYRLAYKLCGGKILDLEKTFELNYINVLNFLSIEKLINDEEIQSMKKNRSI